VTSGLSLTQAADRTFEMALKRYLFVIRSRSSPGSGPVGSDERVLEPDDDPNPTSSTCESPPNVAASFFLYVNESVWAWPGLRDYFYEDNAGKATITVQRPRQSN